MPYISIAGERIYYAKNENAPGENIVFVHGAGENHRIWAKQLVDVPRKTSRPVSAYAFDLPSHDRSEGSGRTSIAAYRDFVAAFTKALGLELFILVGHSMGGAIALDFALTYPGRLRGLVLIGTGARLRVAPIILEQVETSFEGLVSLMSEWAYSPSASRELVRRGEEELRLTPPTVTHGDFAACDAFDVMPRLGEIRTPILVIVGSDDKMTPPKYSMYLRDHIAGAQFILVEGAGHMVMLEQPDVVTAAIARFIDTL
jgi:pimeloyl-ACP methyl ester carboxylesterase